MKRTITLRARGLVGSLALTSYLPRIVLRLLGLAIIDAFALWLLYQLVIDGVWFLAATVAGITLGLNFIFLREDQYPLRWLSPGLVFLILMVVYPLVFTAYTAFTNYSDSHLLTKRQVIRILEKEQYLPEGAAPYSWTAFRSPTGDYMLWLVSEHGKTLLARPGEPAREVAPGEAGIGPLDDDGIPQSIAGYERLSRVDSVRFLPELSRLEFGEPPNTIKITSLDKAGQFQQRYIYHPSQDALVDQKTGIAYRAVGGFFTSPEGEILRPGFQVLIGWRNFRRLFTSRALQWPLIRIFLWTVAFAFLAVVTTFVLGLFLALVFNDPTMPGRKLIRSIFLIPYAMPYFLSILTWRGMLNPHVGIISRILEMLIGWSPPWLSDQWWARVAIVFFVNLWLGFPYMMLICSGALQAIPSELYEAAEVDGASAWQRFRYITLPLLLGMLAPLLVFSFAFNFNNFSVIYLFNKGGPPMPYTITPAGHTDILISYSYRLAFESGRGGDYGYAASITIIIFIVLAAITLFQFRYARRREEVFEGV